MTTKQIAWNTGSGNITLTYQGQGNGTITVNSDSNDLDTTRSQTITVQTLDGVITRNLTVSQAACLVPIGTVFNYAYTGSYQEVTLPAGKYKLQCWGAQGGSNAAASSYSITAQAGGKGGYSEGIITLSQATTLRIYVGGQGSSSAGGFNGGGTTSGSASYGSNPQGVSRMGGGGGATDIRLSDGALLSRMIVAGGGSGGAMCFKKETTTTTTWETIASGSITSLRNWNDIHRVLDITSFTKGDTYKVSWSGVTVNYVAVETFKGSGTYVYTITSNISNGGTFVAPNSTNYNYISISFAKGLTTGTYTVQHRVTTSSTYTYNSSQVGFAGGGTNGVGYSSTYYGTQSAAGSGGSFGQGANQTCTNYRFASGAGGGGWYGGGGGKYSDSDMNYCKYSGGGSGFVNTAASASNRPSGYTGLQLDSGTTYAGNTSFVAPGGGNETGHAGNGYARITRIS